MRYLFILSCCVGLFGCLGDSEGDSSLYLTGTEESAVKNADGEYVCEAPKKVLICHIPPGNPDNAHTICVSTHAVATHQEHHGDPVGACDGGGVEADAGVEIPDVDAGAQDPPPEEEVPVID